MSGKQQFNQPIASVGERYAAVVSLWHSYLKVWRILLVIAALSR